MIKVQNLNFSYQKGENIIHDLSFDVPENSIFGFLGSNGSGKTTAIRLLLNLYTPNRGEVFIKNKKISSNALELYKNIGTLIEAPTFYGHLSGKDNLKLLASYYEVEDRRVEEVLDMVGLLDAKDQKAKKYSLGMKQRLGIASSILHDPEILILDEPLNGLDPKGIARIRDLFFKFQKEDKKTLFISSHLLNEVENTCTDVCIIDKGKKLFAGEINQLKSQLSKGESYRIKCDEPGRAEAILKRVVGVNDLFVDPSALTINVDDNQLIPSCVKALVEDDIQLFEVSKAESNLESLYLNLIK